MTKIGNAKNKRDITQDSFYTNISVFSIKDDSWYTLFYFTLLCTPFLNKSVLLLVLKTYSFL
jgi:hypothetical protein